MRDKIMEIALSQYGISEIRGALDNEDVLKYFNEIGFNGTELKDETAWCSAFANWVVKKAGGEISGKLNARSWLTVGYETKSPQPGDIVVLWRGSKDSWKGHVGFYVSQNKNSIWILGGNQTNQVCIAPYAKTQLLEYRAL